jgi:hypothetical protein
MTDRYNTARTGNDGRMTSEGVQALVAHVATLPVLNRDGWVLLSQFQGLKAGLDAGLDGAAAGLKRWADSITDQEAPVFLKAYVEWILRYEGSV